MGLLLRLSLWATIHFSRSIPYNLKKPIKRRLIKNFEIPILHLTKGVFSHIMRENAYDLFTSSILSIHYRNKLSYTVLNRAQIEIFLFTYWLSKNPAKIKEVFTKKMFKEKGSDFDIFYKKEKDPLIKWLLASYYRYYSQKAHPLPTQFVSSISFSSFMKPKTKNIDFPSLIDGSFNKLPED